MTGGGRNPHRWAEGANLSAGRSGQPAGRPAREGSALERGLVRRGVEQGGELRRGGGSHLEQPAAAVRVVVDQLGGGVERLVAGDDLAGQRGVDVADRLGRLQLAAGRAGGDRLADLGQRDVDDVAERVLRVVGDADPDGAVVLTRAGAPTRARWCTSGPRGTAWLLAGRLPAPGRRSRRDYWAGWARELRLVGLADALDVERGQLLDLDLGAVVLELLARALEEVNGADSVSGSPITSTTYGGLTSGPSTSRPPAAVSNEVWATTRTSPLSWIASAPVGAQLLDRVEHGVDRTGRRPP